MSRRDYTKAIAWAILGGITVVLWLGVYKLLF